MSLFVQSISSFWVNYNDLTRPHPKWWFMWGISLQHLISGWRSIQFAQFLANPRFAAFAVEKLIRKVAPCLVVDNLNDMLVASGVKRPFSLAMSVPVFWLSPFQ